MLERRLDPCMSEVFPLGRSGSDAHMKMLRNEHKPGNMAVLVQAPKAGLRTLEDTLEASHTLESSSLNRKSCFSSQGCVCDGKTCINPGVRRAFCGGLAVLLPTVLGELKSAKWV